MLKPIGTVGFESYKLFRIYKYYALYSSAPKGVNLGYMCRRIGYGNV